MTPRPVFRDASGDPPRIDLAPGGELLLLTPAGGDDGSELRALGARWSATWGGWTAPAAAWVLEWALELLPGADVSPEALDLRLPPLADVFDHPRASLLYPFQVEGASRLVGAAVEDRTGSMLAMSPGLGKTATSIVAADVAEIDQILVVCPASLMHTWAREIKTWSTRPDVQIAHGKTAPTLGPRWTITSYDTLVSKPAWFDRRPLLWPLMILDESVMIKSHQSKRFKTLEGMRVGKARKVLRVWAISGSPMTRYPDDLWTQLRLLAPKAFGSYWRFAERYCYVEPNAWGPGLVVVGPKRSRNAAADNADLMYVVNQEDVLSLPEYLFEAVDVVLGPRQRKAYDDMLRTFYAELEGREIEASTKMVRLLRLVQLASGLGDLGQTDSAKHDALIDLVKDGIYEKPYLIWTHWRQNAENLAARLNAAGIPTAHAHGGLLDWQKDQAIEGFKDGQTDALVISLGVGKFGHTMTNARTIFYVDKTWSADDYVQSLRRVRRIGLKHRPVVVTLRAPGTADDLVEANLEGKLGSIARMTNANLRELLLGLGR